MRLIALKAQVEKEKAKLAATTNAAEKAKIKASIDELTARADKLEKDSQKSRQLRLTGHYAAYGKLLEFKPEDRALLSEIAGSYTIHSEDITK